MDGTCVKCKEWTSAIDSCCGAGVWFEGAVWSQKEALNKILFVATEEAADLEPVDDNAGVPTYGDHEGYNKIAEKYNLDPVKFNYHLTWVFSDQLVGSKYENV